jgi:ubiquinone/menaquinone biosynthesis C-methylase UbiE
MDELTKASIGWKEAANTEKIKWMEKYFDFSSPPKKVLELGSGAGWYSKYVADKGCEIVSIDLNPLFTDDRITIKTANLEEKLNLKNNDYDYVIAWDIIEHIKKDKQLLDEIYRVSKKGAICLVSVPHINDSRIASSYLTYCHFKDKTHKREYTIMSLKKSFIEANFDVIDIKLHGGDAYPYAIMNFIDNSIAKRIMKISIKCLMKMGIINIKDCHGDIFGGFKK